MKGCAKKEKWRWKESQKHLGANRKKRLSLGRPKQHLISTLSCLGKIGIKLMLNPPQPGKSLPSASRLCPNLKSASKPPKYLISASQNSRPEIPAVGAKILHPNLSLNAHPNRISPNWSLNPNRSFNPNRSLRMLELRVEFPIA